MRTEKSELTHKTLQLLEFDRILERLAACAMSEEASAMIKDEKPCGDPAVVAQTREAVQAIIFRINEGDGSSREGRRYLPSIGFLIPRLELEGMALAIDEACAIGLFVERGEELKKWLAPHSEGNPGSGEDRRRAPVFAEMLQRLLDGMPDCAGLAAAVFRVMDREGKLRDLPELRAIKQRIQSLKAALNAAVSRYTGSEDTRHMLQSTLPSLRDGRTVIAVKANFRGRIRGIVHEVSSSGQTIFVEPEDVVEKNNDILIENRNLDAEIRRIMLDVTRHIAGRIGELKAFRLIVLSLEVLMAKARYSLETSGCFAPPSI